MGEWFETHDGVQERGRAPGGVGVRRLQGRHPGPVPGDGRHQGGVVRDGHVLGAESGFLDVQQPGDVDVQGFAHQAAVTP